MEARQLNWFYQMFQGNTLFYVKHCPPFRKEGEKRLARKVVFAKQDGEFLPLTKDEYRAHLEGETGLAVCPLTDAGQLSNVCFYALIDIDKYDQNFTWLVKRLYDLGFKFAAFPSKSGGVHIYFFFRQPEPAKLVIETMQRVVHTFGMDRIFVSENGNSKVEIFPDKAMYAPGDAKPHCVFLPFYNAAGKSKQGMITPDNKLVQLEKAMPVIESSITTLAEITETLNTLPYSDAPYCIQMLALTGVLTEGEGRNNFLFSAAVYLKKKQGSGFLDALKHINQRLSDPLPDSDLEDICDSVMKREYHYRCTSFPCAHYCDKAACKKREHSGVKKDRDRDNDVTGADCWGQLTKYMSEEPYYLWEVRVSPDEPFRTVKLNSVDELDNQAIVRKRCWRDLHWAPFRVSDNAWIKTVNTSMQGIEERQIEVPKATDTSDLSDLRNCFLKYLTHKQVQRGGPHLVQVDQVYHRDGVYFFTHTGLKEFLRIEKLTLGRTNLREWLLDQGCSEAELEWETRSGKKVTKSCWKKPEDAELLAMDVIYEDIYDSDEDILQKDQPHTPEEGTDDVRF